MNKNELKQARKELVDMMHALRVIQKGRKTSTDKEKYNKEIDKLLFELMVNNMNYSFEMYSATHSDKDFVDGLVTDLKKMKNKK